MRQRVASRRQRDGTGASGVCIAPWELPVQDLRVYDAVKSRLVASWIYDPPDPLR
jgi:hypothetical protein